MLESVFGALINMIRWLDTVVWGLLGVKRISTSTGGGSWTDHVWRTGFDQLLPLFCIGIAASIVMVSTKIVRKACNRL